MTDEYERRRPEAFRAGPCEAAVLHWSHSIVIDPGFVFGWHAQQEASDLSAELGISEEVRIDACSLHFRQPLCCQVRPICDEVQVHINVDDDKEFPPVIFRQDALSNWEDKPWALRPVTAPTNPTVPSSSSTASNPGEAGHHEVTPSQSPAWHSAINQLLHDEGQLDAHEGEWVVYVNSYYIDHTRHLFHDTARIPRFDQNWAEWDAGVRHVWEDLVDPAAALDIVMIQPQPPFFPFRGTSATIIVQQHPVPTRAACLLTAVFPMDPDFMVLETAHSLERILQQPEILRLAGVEAHCQHRRDNGFGECTMRFGLQILPPAQELHTHEGLSILIHVPPPMSADDVGHNLALRLRPPPPEAVPDHVREPEDTVSLMARSLSSLTRRPSSTSLSSSSVVTLLHLQPLLLRSKMTNVR